mgnify:CR=1 FL=1
MLQNVSEGRDPVKMLNSMSLICSRRRQNSLASRNLSTHFHSADFSRAAQAAKSAAERSEAQTPSWTLSSLPKHADSSQKNHSSLKTHSSISVSANPNSINGVRTYLSQRYANLVVNIAEESGQEGCECGSCGKRLRRRKFCSPHKFFETDFSTTPPKWPRLRRSSSRTTGDFTSIFK